MITQSHLVTLLTPFLPEAETLTATRIIAATSDDTQLISAELRPALPLLIKIIAAPEQGRLRQEYEGLYRLTKAQMAVPHLYGYNQDQHYAVLCMARIVNETANELAWRRAGAMLAQLHNETTQSYYGNTEDNYIGPNRQPNGQYEQWASFFSEQRIRWQLELAEQQGLYLGNCDRICQVIYRQLEGYQPTSSLLHGDLWRGNLVFEQQQPYYIDPACYYGDGESDLAMTELFGGFHTAFYQAYLALRPLPAQYQQRRTIYQLYHILNHANLFGGGYIQQAQHLIQQLI